jgi:hypothetical protein
MAFDRFVENLIQEAIARGEFDNLKGSGKPLNLDEYFSLPEDMRASFTLLRNAGVAPQEVGLLKEIAQLKEKLDKQTDENKRKKLITEIADKQLKFDMLMEQRRKPKRA